MKKFLSALLAAVMLVSSFTATAIAEDTPADAPAGEIYLDADFSSDGAAAQDFYLGAYKTEDGVLVGYKEALAFQSVKGWSSYDNVFEITFTEDDTIEEPVPRSFSFAYLSDNLKHNGLYEDTYCIGVYYDLDNDTVSLVADDFWPKEFEDGSNNYIVEPVPCEIEDNETYTFGISVSEKQMRVFVNGELIIDFVDEENKYYIGFSYEEVEPSIFLWWNSNNCVMYSDVKISAPGVLLPFPEPIMYGDANDDGSINLSDVSLMLRHIAKWEGLEMNAEATDVNVDGSINLSDVSLTLKHIAGWENIVLGPREIG